MSKTFPAPLITEQFYTIQGEGPSVGQPAYFIRLAGCNLWCEWCDSLHSVDPSQFKGKTTAIDYQKIPTQSSIVVITGGEPTLFDLASIEKQIKKVHPTVNIEIESNATYFPKESASLFNWNLSPKLKSSKQKTDSQDQKRLKSLSEWVQFSNTTQKRVIFKFVIADKADLNEVQSLVSEYKIPQHLVYLMAEGQTTDSQSLTAVEQIIDFCKAQGFNFTPRLHIQLWQKKRGV